MESDKKQGKFIVFEGIDGSGQSTQARLLADFFEKQGKNVVLTKEPTAESVAGKKIREALGKRIAVSPDKLQKLFAEDRKEHLETVIAPALKSGKFVISDRYMFSSFAFGAIDCDLEWLVKINSDFLTPDVAFLLLVPPSVAMERIKKRGSPLELFETLEKLKKVDENYRKLPARFPCISPINGEQPIEAVRAEIAQIAESIIE